MRLFVASRIGVDAARRIQDAVRPLKGQAGRASWVAADAYHLTYAFLGEQSEAIITPLAGRLAEELAESGSVNLTLSGGGFFPKERRARVAWIGMKGADRLDEIAVCVRRVLDEIGVAYDTKPFRPHLTIARIRGRWSAGDTALYSRTIDGLGAIPVVLDRVVVYRSELSSGGARHSEVGAVTLSR